MKKRDDVIHPYPFVSLGPPRRCLPALSASASRPLAHTLCDFAPHACCSHCYFIFLVPRISLSRINFLSRGCIEPLLVAFDLILTLWWAIRQAWLAHSIPFRVRSSHILLNHKNWLSVEKFEAPRVHIKRGSHLQKNFGNLVCLPSTLCIRHFYWIIELDALNGNS